MADYKKYSFSHRSKFLTALAVARARVFGQLQIVSV